MLRNTGYVPRKGWVFGSAKATMAGLLPPVIGNNMWREAHNGGAIGHNGMFIWQKLGFQQSTIDNTNCMLIQFFQNAPAAPLCEHKIATLFGTIDNYAKAMLIYKGKGNGQNYTFALPPFEPVNI